MIRLSAAAIFVSTALVASSALAQGDDEELIFDPENPAFQTEEVQEGVESNREGAESTDEETIFDPENPGLETIDDPENPAIDREETIADPENTIEAPEIGAGAGFQRARFLGNYGTGLQLDTAFDGAREDVFEQLTRVDLRVEFDPSDTLSVVLEGEFRHWWSAEEGFAETTASYDARLGEAYVLWRNGPWTVNAGNLVTSWGATDIVRPGDVVNPVDLTEFSATGAMERVPQLTLDVGHHFGDGWAAHALLVPFFVPNRVWAYGRDTAILSPSNALVARELPLYRVLDVLVAPSRTDDVQPLFQASDIPDEGPSSVSAGGRITGTFWNTDVGAGYFFGWDRTPYLVLDDGVRDVLTALANDPQVLADLDLLAFFGRNPELAATFENIQDAAVQGDDLFSSEYRRLHTFQLDLARYIGPVGVRMDAAFQPVRTFITTNLQSRRRPTLSGALGLSYERLMDEDDALVISVEGFVIHALEANSGMAEAFIDASERGTNDDEFFLFEKTTAGTAAAIAWTIPYGNLQLQLGGVHLVNSGDLLLGASIQKRWATYLVTGISALAFENLADREDAIGAIYDRNDSLSLDITGTF